MWNWSENQVRTVLLRHGATASNAEHRYLGRTDEALSEAGISALRQAKQKGSYPGTDIVFSGPMKRCIETAQILYPDRKCVLIPEWTEIDFGAFEGKNFLELRGDKRYQAWIDSGGILPFPEGESREAFTARCRRGLYRMFEELAQFTSEYCPESGYPVTAAVIVHGGTIMALLSLFGSDSYFDYQVENGNGYVCTWRGCAGSLEAAEIVKLF